LNQSVENHIKEPGKMEEGAFLEEQIRKEWIREDGGLPTF
jgi:hypothetical protein